MHNKNLNKLKQSIRKDAVIKGLDWDLWYAKKQVDKAASIIVYQNSQLKEKQNAVIYLSYLLNKRIEELTISKE